jgi:hypothetical protein
MTYEHPPGAQIKGKNNSESLVKQVTGLGTTVSESVARVAAAVGGAIGYFLKEMQARVQRIFGSETVSILD